MFFSVSSDDRALRMQHWYLIWLVSNEPRRKRIDGCSYAKGASGNVVTEDVAYMFNGLGFEYRINLDKLIAAGNITEKLNRNK